MTRTYYTLDNGGRPFKVIITKIDDHYKIIVLVNKNEKYSNPREFAACQVFIGKSPLTTMTSFSGGSGPKFNGNSILFRNHIDRLDYTFIGHEVYQFKAKEKIVKYQSEIGNSGVPYPWARDKYRNYYLMVEYVIILDFKENDDDVYEWYYDNSKKRDHLPMKQKMIKKRPM